MLAAPGALFQDLRVPIQPVSSVAPSSNVKNYGRGAVIADEGSAGAGWYVLLSGRVGVFKQGTQVAEFANRGIVFGEIANILARPRTAQLVAIEPSSLIHFEANLDELITKHPNIAKTVLISLAQRLEKTTEALWIAVQAHHKELPPLPPMPPATAEAEQVPPDEAN